jgi:biotin synthase
MSSPTLADLQRVYHQPFFELIEHSHAVHKEYWKSNEVQLCALLSIKTGGCSEDCAYCAQSARYSTSVRVEKMLPLSEVVAAAEKAKRNGAVRFCMGAAWRGAREGTAQFESVLDIVRAVNALGLEVCVTLGELSETAAQQLKKAGAAIYNHNLDTSPEFYTRIITTHSFEDRLRTIRAVQQAGLGVCCGGIIGLGESDVDRLRMLQVLASFDPPPESVPLNCLVPIAGTPLENLPSVDILELVRLVATTRITLPSSRVRLSAGRSRLSREAQALCFYAGANSIFFGEKLLTAENAEADADLALLTELGLSPQ